MTEENKQHNGWNGFLLCIIIGVYTWILGCSIFVSIIGVLIILIIIGILNEEEDDSRCLYNTHAYMIKKMNFFFIIGIVFLFLNTKTYGIYLITTTCISYILYKINKGGEKMEEESNLTRFIIAISVAMVSALPSFYYTWGLYKENVLLPWIVMGYLLLFTGALLPMMKISDKLNKNK